MKTTIKILTLLVIFQGCSLKNKPDETSTPEIQEKVSVKSSFFSIEVLKTEKVAEPTKYYYYFVERNLSKEIIDSVLLMTPETYDYRIKPAVWSMDSTIFAFESLQSIGSNQQIELFDVEKREKVFKTDGRFFAKRNKENCELADKGLNQILFYRLERDENTDNGVLSIFILNTSNFTIDTLKTLQTKVDIWESPGLFNSNWTEEKFKIIHTPEYNNLTGCYVRDTLEIVIQ